MILFFVRRLNDIDHLTPIIYKLRRETKRELMVLCQNPAYDIEDDLRLRFLREKHNVVVKYVYEAYLPGRIHRILSYFVCGKPENSLVRNFLKLSRKLLYDFVYNKLVINNYFGEKWAVGLFSKYQATILVFDFVKNRQYITKALVGAAKSLKIPTVAIPPGAMLFVDRLGQPIESFEEFDLPNYDYLLVQHELRKDLYLRIGFPAEKMFLFGITRFCREWENVLWKIIPPDISKENTGKLKVLYIDRPVDYNMDKESVVEMIRTISELDFIHLLVKPHTRSNRLKFEELKKYGEIVADIDSVELVRWADVVIGTTSSILLEVLCQNKTLLYPKYINKSTMVFERMNACWCVNGLDELVSALEKIGAQPEYRPYSNKDVDKLMDKIVYCNDSKRDVLNNYKNFILDKQRRWMQI